MNEEVSDEHPPEPAACSVGRLGPYEIRGVIGSGGIGTVYRAWDDRLGREVALKVLSGGDGGSMASLADLEREARLLASLSHPAILGIFDVGEDQGKQYVTTELLVGVDLHQRMAGRPLPWRTAVAIVLEVAKGLAAAHARGVIHLDLKPENIFVLAQGGVKILDFGLARRESEPAPSIGNEDASPPGGQRALAGTIAYLTPEQIAGDPVDHRADIFSLGSVLFEVLTGAPPFQRDTLTRTLHAIAEEDPPPLSAPGLTIPPGLGRIVRRCLNKNPDTRFQTALDLAFALSEQLTQGTAPPASRSDWPFRLVWFVVGAATALGGIFLLHLLLG